MKIRLALLPCSLLLFSCSQLPKDQVGGAAQQASATEEMVTARALPEVRYYLIADT
jgi:hypothetical protein